MCKVHNRVRGIESVEALVVARDEGNVCERRLKYLEGCVRSFRDWMMKTNDISKEEANSRLLRIADKLRKALAEETFDLFVWGGEELRMDNLTDLNANCDTLEEKLDAVYDQHGKLEGIAANVAWRAQRQVWMENSRDLRDKGEEWLNSIETTFSGVAQYKDAYRIKRFQKRVHALRFKTKQLTYNDWSWLINYSNELLGLDKQYRNKEQGVEKTEKKTEVYNSSDKTEEMPSLPEEIIEELKYLAAI